MTAKTCKKCLQTKDISFFGNRKNGRDGKSSQCKECVNKYASIRYAAHGEDYRRRHREWYKRNSTHARSYRKEYHLKNTNQENQYSRTWKSENKAKLKEYNRQYHSAYYQKNSKSVKEEVLRHQKENPELARARWHRYRAKKSNNGGDWAVKEWQWLFTLCGNKCLACGKRGETMHKDHVVPISSGGINSIVNLQPLCQSCNSKKGTKTIDYRPQSVRDEIAKKYGGAETPQ